MKKRLYNRVMTIGFLSVCFTGKDRSAYTPLDPLKVPAQQPPGNETAHKRTHKRMVISLCHTILYHTILYYGPCLFVLQSFRPCVLCSACGFFLLTHSLTVCLSVCQREFYRTLRRKVQGSHSRSRSRSHSTRSRSKSYSRSRSRLVGEDVFPLCVLSLCFLSNTFNLLHCCYRSSDHHRHTNARSRSKRRRRSYSRSPRSRSRSRSSSRSRSRSHGRSRSRSRSRSNSSPGSHSLSRRHRKSHKSGSGSSHGWDSRSSRDKDRDRTRSRRR